MMTPDLSKDLLVALKAMVAEFDKLCRYGSPIARDSNESVRFARDAISKTEAWMACPIVNSVAADLYRRAEVGLQKYGVTLARTDLDQRAWLQHTYEEMLDAACYIKRLMLDLE